MNKIFFSYTLHDGNIQKKFLLELQKWVYMHGQECYIDILESEYNEIGFQEQLLKELKKCNIFCQINSPEYFNSKWTQKELKEAMSQNMCIVKIDACRLKNIVENNLNISTII